MIDQDVISLVESSNMKTGNNYGTGMIIYNPATKSILMAKRVDTDNWCTPGGKVELGESPLQGVLRETTEESGIVVHSCQFYDYTMNTAGNGKNWVSFMFITTDYDVSNLANQESEVGPWGWYQIEDALGMDLFPPTRKSLLRAIDLGIIDMPIDNPSYYPYVEMPASATGVEDSCACAYSYSEPEHVFVNNQGLYWD